MFFYRSRVFFHHPLFPQYDTANLGPWCLWLHINTLLRRSLLLPGCLHCQKHFGGKSFFSFNDIYSAQKLGLIFLKLCTCVGCVAWQNKHGADEWHCERLAITMAYLQRTSEARLIKTYITLHFNGQLIFLGMKDKIAVKGEKNPLNLCSQVLCLTRKFHDSSCIVQTSCPVWWYGIQPHRFDGITS